MTTQGIKRRVEKLEGPSLDDPGVILLEIIKRIGSGRYVTDADIESDVKRDPEFWDRARRSFFSEAWPLLIQSKNKGDAL